MAATLQDSRERFALDLERSRREGFKFGAKLVRGAYMFLEREKAAKSGRPSPVWDSIQDTHANYDRRVILCYIAMACLSVYRQCNWMMGC